MLPVMKQALSANDAKALTQCIMNDKQLKEFESTQECNFAIAPPNLGRFRVNAFVQQGCPRFGDAGDCRRIPNFDKLGLPTVLKDVIMAKNGFNYHGWRHRFG